jgi:hypothetical protein
MADSFTEVTSEGFFTRIRKSIGGIGVGLLLFVASFVVLWWNEGRAVRRSRTLAEGAANVVHIEAAPVNADFEGKLVHLTGLAKPVGTVSDPVLGLSFDDAIRIDRHVEMYQWVEKKKTRSRERVGGRKDTSTTYSYSRQWQQGREDSSDFKDPQGHQNPVPALSGGQDRVETVTLGDFRLSPELVGKIAGGKPVAFTSEQKAKINQAVGPELSGRMHFQGETIYIGDDPQDPNVGDLRVTLRKTPASTVSVVARQIGETFEQYTTDNGSLLMLSMGTQSAKQMFDAAKAANAMWTWLLRLGGFLMMLLGITMVLSPLRVVASFIPLLGSIVGVGLFLVALVISLPLTLATIAIAWLVYRPVLGVALLVVAVGAAVALGTVARKNNSPSPAKEPAS